MRIAEFAAWFDAFNSSGRWRRHWGTLIFPRPLEVGKLSRPFLETALDHIKSISDPEIEALKLYLRKQIELDKKTSDPELFIYLRDLDKIRLTDFRVTFPELALEENRI